MPGEAPADAESRLKKAYDEFMGQLEALKKDRLDVVKKVVGRIEQEKIEEIMKYLR